MRFVVVVVVEDITNEPDNSLSPDSWMTKSTIKRTFNTKPLHRNECRRYDCREELSCFLIKLLGNVTQ